MAITAPKNNSKKTNPQNIFQVVSGSVVLFFYALSGALFIFFPNMAYHILLVALGILLCLEGAFQVFGFFKAPPERSLKNLGFALGLMGIMIGVLCFASPASFQGILQYVFSLSILLGAFVKVQSGLVALRLKDKDWWLSMALAAVSLVLGGIAVFVLGNATSSLPLGIFLWVELVMDVFCIIYTKKQSKIQNPEAKPNPDQPGEQPAQAEQAEKPKPEGKKA